MLNSTELPTVPLYAILVGIDDYREPFPKPLERAVGDVKKLETLLLNHPQIKVQGIKILTDQEATRENIIKALSSLPDELTRETAVLFYYSGYAAIARRPDSQAEVGVLCPCDTYQTGAISDKSLVELLERMSISQGGNITVFLDCTTRSFSWGKPSSFVVVTPKTATETEDGGSFTKFLIEVLGKHSERLDGLTIQTLADKLGVLMDMPIHCVGQKADRVIFNPRAGGAYYPFITGRTQKDGRIVLMVGSAHGIQADTVFGVYASNVTDPWNTRLGYLKVESVEDINTNLCFQRDGSFNLPSVFFAVQCDSELDTINVFLPDGAVEALKSIPGWKEVSESNKADLTLGFKEDEFSPLWNGIDFDKEHMRVTGDIEPFSLQTKSLRGHLRNYARFKSHVTRSNPNSTFMARGLDLQLVEGGRSGDASKSPKNILSEDFAEIVVNENERRGAFSLILRNRNRFRIWPWVFLCTGADHTIATWYEPQPDSPLGHDKITIPHNPEDDLYFIWRPDSPPDLLYIKIFATTEYRSFSSIQQQFRPSPEDSLREIDQTKSSSKSDSVLGSESSVYANISRGLMGRELAKWASIRLTIKVKYVQEDEATKTKNDDTGSDGGKEEGDSQ